MTHSWSIGDDSQFTAVRLGEQRDVVRERLGAFTTFTRTPGGREVDDFTDHSAQVTYDSDGKAAFIEVSGPTEVTFRGIRLTDRAPEVVYRELRAAGVSVDEDDQGALLDSGAVGIYADEDAVLAVSVGTDVPGL